jgi:thiol-disulfide isomerase/thioredoxin
MLRASLPLSTLIPLLLPCLTAQDAKDIWTQDFAKAKATAKEAKKDLFVDFTGSDWCGWCIKLDKEVFAHAEWKDEVQKHFVLVKLDYPNEKSLVTEEVRQQNEKLQGEYSIQGYPTILLMDHEGRVYAKLGYEEGGPSNYNERLGELRKTGDTLKAAVARSAAAKGAERATALDEALTAIGEEVADSHHLASMKEIVALDADGAAKLKDKYEAKVKELEAAKELNDAAQSLNQLIGEDMQKGEGEKALAKLEAVIKAPKNQIHHQMALFFKGMVIMDTSGDAKAAVASLEAAVKLAPESTIAKRIAQILPEIKQMVGDGKEEGGR